MPGLQRGWGWLAGLGACSVVVVERVEWVEEQQGSVGVVLLGEVGVMRGMLGVMQGRVVGEMRGWVGVIRGRVGVVLGMVVEKMLLAFAALLGNAAHLGSWGQPFWGAAVGASAVGTSVVGEVAVPVGFGVCCNLVLAVARRDTVAGVEGVVGPVFDLVGPVLD